MTVPRDHIWQSAFNDALDVIQESVSGTLKDKMTFFEWREKGGYHVPECTKLHFIVDCASKEFGFVIAKEVTLLLDQALEHRLLIAHAFREGKHPSPSWLLVTIYYWCLFLALAWLRLTGKIVTYLPSEEINRLAKLSSSSNLKRPGNGTFIIELLKTEGSRFNLKYRRLKTNNFHEGLWNAFHQDIRQRLKAAGSKPASWETRLFSVLNFENDNDHSGWLSKLRNIVNYRIGFGYGAVDGKIIPDILSFLPTSQIESVESIITKLEEVQSKTGRRPVPERPEQYANIMLLFGSLMTKLMDSLTKDVWDKRAIEENWSQKRKKYTALHGEDIEKLWPWNS